MKKHLVLVCASIAFVGANMDSVLATRTPGGQASHTTAEQRAGQSALAQGANLTVKTIVGLNSVALNDLINGAPNSPIVIVRLLEAAKADVKVRRALLSKLENNIGFRDQILNDLIKDAEFCDLVKSTHAQEFPKTSSVLVQAKAGA